MQIARTFRMSVSGESFRNDDGTSRQAILEVADPSMVVELRPEPENQYDDEAVSVHIVGLGQVGYLPRDHGLFDDIDAGLVAAKIDKITGGTANKPSRGIALEIQILQDAQARAAPSQKEVAVQATSSPAPPSDKPQAAKRSTFAAIAMLLTLAIALGWVMKRPPSPAPTTSNARPMTSAPVVTPPPVVDRPLSKEEIVELQRRLTRKGFDTKGADGLVGPNTIAAIKRFQTSRGLTPTGESTLLLFIETEK